MKVGKITVDCFLIFQAYFSIHSVEKNMHFLTEYFSENRYQTQRLCIIMGFGKRENTFDWRIYMKKVPIKELREDLK